MSGPSGDVTAAKIELFLAEQGGELERAEADGNVVSRQDLRRAYGQHLTYHAKNESYTMTGSPVKVYDDTPPDCRVTEGAVATFQRDRQRLVGARQRGVPAQEWNGRVRRRARILLNGDAAHPRSHQVIQRTDGGQGASTSRSPPVKSSACSARTARARRRRSRWWSGLTAPDSGRVLLDGIDVTEDPMYIRARKGIGYLPQEASIFRGLSVEQNIMAILETLDLDGPARRTRLRELLAELGLTPLAKSPAYTLSGGERRRVEITRALVISPKFILLDEPFAGIDPIAVTDIQKIIFHLKSRGIGVLITDHNVRETLRITDRAYIVHDGVIFKSGTPQSLADDEEVKRIYLGADFRLD